MAHPSKTARKKRNRNRGSVQGQLLAAQQKNQQMAGLAIAAHNQSAHLAKLLAYVVAKYGDKGTLTIPDRDLAVMPENAKLREIYDQETDSIKLTSVVVSDAPRGEKLVGSEQPIVVGIEAPAIEVITPKIVVIDEVSEISPAAIEIASS